MHVSSAMAAHGYVRTTSLKLPGAIVRDAVWHSGSRLLLLQQGLDGASVLSLDYGSMAQSQFISSSFMASHVCPPAAVSSLRWTVSPRRRYLIFHWQDGDSRRWALLDVSQAPSFRLKRVNTPPGMQVESALFSPDERWLVLSHDAAQQGSTTALLVLDLEKGGEALRVETSSINFIGHSWWAGAVLDSPRFYAAARLYNGQFFDTPGLAQIDINSRQLRFVHPGTKADLLLGSSALWGRVDAFADNSKGAAASYGLQASVPGYNALKPVPLSTLPLRLQCLSTPGLVLINNTADYQTYELWLVNVLDGSKTLVDGDCASFDLAPDNRLLVRSKTSNNLRVYQLSSEGY
jgi:dipeptidyl aminopeptidase/acylaminoacyl peptidase